MTTPGPATSDDPLAAITRTCPIETLRRLCDPTVEWCWVSIPPTMPLTLEQVVAHEPVPEPFNDDSPFNTSLHLGRIHWLILHGWDDPIHIDVGCPGLGYNGPDWPLLDGNHRLAAGVLRHDDRIDVYPAGDLDHATTLLQPDRPW